MKILALKKIAVSQASAINTALIRSRVGGLAGLVSLAKRAIGPVLACFVMVSVAATTVGAADFTNTFVIKTPTNHTFHSGVYGSTKYADGWGVYGHALSDGFGVQGTSKSGVGVVGAVSDPAGL